MFLDFFNQPITEKSKVLASVYGKLKLCSVQKFNKKTIVISDVDFLNGRPIRINPENTVVVSEEDLAMLVLRKGISL